jgi:uncharacterized protein (TIGR03790 family)
MFSILPRVAASRMSTTHWLRSWHLTCSWTHELASTLKASAFGRSRSERAPAICTGPNLLTYCRRSAVTLRLAACASGLAVSLAYAAAAEAQSAENVAVVINDASAASRRIGEYYASKRGLPASNIIHVNTTQDEEVDRRTYATSIEWPVRARISQQRLHDRILYIVLTKGVPLRILGSRGQYGTFASVDAELTLMYRRMTGQQLSPLGAVDNPYFLSTREISEARPFTHRDHDLFLVTRLDGYTVEDALALIDRATGPAAEGDIVLATEKPPRTQAVTDWLSTAASRLAQPKSRQRVLIETSVAPADDRPVFGYFASSSETNSGRPLRTMRFVPGSLAARFAEADARTFREPSNVRRTTRSDRDVLLGDLIRAGVTGAAGFVGDPTGGSIVRPDILFPAYVAGFNLAEAFYMAMPHLSRRTVVIGDPLCAPFRQTILSRSDIETPPDPVMEISAAFARRRLESLQSEYPHVSEGALMLSIRANTYDQRGDSNTAQRLLEAATRFAPDFASAHAQLAVLYDRAAQHDLAIERYRRALDAQPPYVRAEIVEISNSAGLMEVRQLALNNLAYNLAVYRHAPEEALPFARRALGYAPDDPDLLDTLGWIEHLLGDDNNAIMHLRAAVARMSVSADAWLHAAVVAAAFNLRAEAEKYLNIALQLNAALDTSEEVAAVRAHLTPAAVPSR